MSDKPPSSSASLFRRVRDLIDDLECHVDASDSKAQTMEITADLALSVAGTCEACEKNVKVIDENKRAREAHSILVEELKETRKALAVAQKAAEDLQERLNRQDDEYGHVVAQAGVANEKARAAVAENKKLKEKLAAYEAGAAKVKATKRKRG